MIGFLCHSQWHKFLFISDIEWLVLPPVALGQYRLLRRNGQPIAYASWACVSQEVDARLEAGNLRLRPGDWASGDQWWLIDFVVPANESEAVFTALRDQVFKDRQIKALQLRGAS